MSDQHDRPPINPSQTALSGLARSGRAFSGTVPAPAQPVEIELDLVSDPERPPETDVVDFGRRAPSRQRRVLAGVLMVAALLVGVLIYSHTRDTPPANAGSTAPSLSPSATAGTPSRAATASPTFRGTTTLGGPLLGVTSGWVLYVRSASDVVRIQLAAGKITDTQAPPLSNSGEVTFLATSGGVLARPAHTGAGYLLPDGTASRPLAGSLSTPGLVFPGPTPDTFWAVDETFGPHVELVDPGGRPVGGAVPIAIDVPSGNAGQLVADGTGYLLFTGNGGVYDLHPGTSKRIATGSLLAVGPTMWLVRDCDNRGVCLSYTVDSRTGARHQVEAVDIAEPVMTGVLSPDGRMLAVIDTSMGQLKLVTTATGQASPVSVLLGSVGVSGQFVWSPDGKWLLVVDSDGHLHAVEAATHNDNVLTLPIPTAIQLAVRPAASG